MIAGIGVDLIEVARVERAYAKEKFQNKIYTLKERELIGNRMQTAAGNFAAKEATVKAFGTGFGKIRPLEIEVLREVSGKPYIVLHGEARNECERQRISSLLVSISNTKEYAVAYVTAEQKATEGTLS